MKPLPPPIDDAYKAAFFAELERLEPILKDDRPRLQGLWKAAADLVDELNPADAAARVRVRVFGSKPAPL